MRKAWRDGTDLESVKALGAPSQKMPGNGIILESGSSGFAL